MTDSRLIAASLLLLAAACATTPAAHDPSRDPAAALKRQTLLLQYRVPADGMIPVALFDADSTLRVSLSGVVTATSANDVLILPCVAQRIKQLVDEGYFVAIVSNQGGFANLMKKGQTDAANQQLVTSEAALATTVQLINAQARAPVIHYFDMAENEDDFRK